MDFKPEYLEKLAKIINDNGLTEISMEDGDQAITIRKDLPEVVVGASAPVVSAPAWASLQRGFKLRGAIGCKDVHRSCFHPRNKIGYIAQRRFTFHAGKALFIGACVVVGAGGTA